jgi:hypothetical protein
MIDMPRIREWTENLGNARHVLFMIDACFSGLSAVERKGDNDVKDRTIERLRQPASHIVTAGIEGEESFIVNHESLFTKGFLAAARGTISTPKDGIISISEIVVQVDRFLDGERARLRDKIKMSPHVYYSRIENNAGEFFFRPDVKVPQPDVKVAPQPIIPLPQADVLTKGDVDPKRNGETTIDVSRAATQNQYPNVRGSLYNADGTINCLDSKTNSFERCEVLRLRGNSPSTNIPQTPRVVTQNQYPNVRGSLYNADGTINCLDSKTNSFERCEVLRLRAK